MDDLRTEVLDSIRECLGRLRTGDLERTPENYRELLRLAEIGDVPEQSLIRGWIEAAGARGLAREARARSQDSRLQARRLRERRRLRVIPSTAAGAT